MMAWATDATLSALLGRLAEDGAGTGAGTPSRRLLRRRVAAFEAIAGLSEGFLLLFVGHGRSFPCGRAW